MSSASYAPVSREETDPRDDASDSSSAPPRALLTKRTVYSSHRIESRMPRLAGETDAAFKRRVHVAHAGAMLHSVAWVAAAVAVLYYTDLWNVVRYDTRLNHSFLLLSCLSGFVLTLVLAYLAVWVPMTAARPVQDLGAYAPTAAMIGALSGVATFTFLMIALWPIWGFVTLPIILVLAMAACLGPNLLPV